VPQHWRPGHHLRTFTRRERCFAAQKRGDARVSERALRRRQRERATRRCELVPVGCGAACAAVCAAGAQRGASGARGTRLPAAPRCCAGCACKAAADGAGA
jgi:hypothetical protein